MSEELSPSEVGEPDLDIDKTPTQADAPKPSSGGWTMPEPVFKKTSGYLPQGFNKPFSHYQGNENSTVEQPKPDVDRPTVADVEPQPDVIDDGLLDPAIEAPPPVKKKGIVGRIMMVLLALFIVLLMAAVVLGVMWFVFWPRPEGTIN